MKIPKGLPAAAAVAMLFWLLPGVSRGQCTGCPKASFGPAARAYELSPYSVGRLVTADFNMDGNLDLAAGGAFNVPPFSFVQGVGVMLGDSRGRFGSVIASDANQQPQFMTAADFDRDGRPDLAVSHYAGCSVLRGTGSGSFEAPRAVDTSSSTGPVEAGDFNGDRLPDLALIRDGGNALQFFLGDGAGSFTASAILPVGPSGFSLEVGDFNGDGISDVAVANGGSNTVSRILGSGGTFAPPQNFTSVFNAQSSAMADFNQDGKLDLVLAPYSSPVAVLFGNGFGGFGAPLLLGSSEGEVVAGDFDGDGDSDLATADGDSVAIFSGNGAGSFSSPSSFPAQLALPLAADWNRDGASDLAGVFGSKIVTYLSGSPGRLVFPSAYSLNFSSGGPLAAADFSGDGRPDLAVANGYGNLTLLVTNASLALTFASNHALPFLARGMAVGDFNADGKPDLAVSNGDGISLFRGTGSSLGPRSDFPVGSAPLGLATGDLNLDGKLDILTANSGGNSISVLLGTGTGSFLPDAEYAVGTGPRSLAVADFNADGRLDTVVANGGGGVSSVALLLGDGAGAFSAIVFLPAGIEAESIGAVDLDSDGRFDVAVARGNGNVTVLRGNGDGSFQAPVDYPGPQDPGDLRISDFNLDGHADIAVGNISGGAVVFINDGAGGLTSPDQFLAGNGALGLAVADFDLDGRPDLALSSNYPGHVGILRNTNCLVRAMAVETDPPACASANIPFSPQPLLRLYDDGGNPLSCIGGNVTASIAPGTGPASAVLNGTKVVPFTGGVASFSDLSVDRAGTGYRLRFSHPTGGVALSRSFSAGSAVITAPASVCPFAASLVASVPDLGPGTVYLWTIANGVITAGTGTRSVTFRAGPSGQVNLSLTILTGDGCNLSSSASVAIVSGAACPPPVGFFTVQPCRVADTRGPDGPLGGPALLSSATRSFPVVAHCGIPTSARAVAVNVTVVSQAQAGHFTLFAAGTPPPPTSTLNFPGSAIRANNAVVPLGAAGDIAVQCVLSAPGIAHFLLDLTGYFE